MIFKIRSLVLIDFVKKIFGKNNKVSYTFPPHSFTQIKVAAKRN
jgi:hypothetical protein